MESEFAVSESNFAGSFIPSEAGGKTNKLGINNCVITWPGALYYTINLIALVHYF